MMKINYQKFFYYVIVFIIFLISFRSFAASFYPKLDADHVIHALMTYDLKLPDDLYYWGQNRLGSFVPILGHIIIQILPISPIQAISLIQYLILAVGFICLTSLFKNTSSKFIFALAWFLPLSVFSELVQPTHPYALQLTFIAIAIVAIKKLVKADAKLSNLTKHILTCTAVSSLVLGLWISELTIVYIFLIGLISVLPLVKIIKIDAEKFKFSFILNKWILANVIFSTLVGVGFLKYAKNHAISADENIANFNNLEDIGIVISKILAAIFATLTFQVNNLFLSGATILVIVAGALIFSDAAQAKKVKFSRWFFLFFSSTILCFLALVCSRWVFINDVPARYFTVLYVSSWMAGLLYLEQMSQEQAKKIYICLTLVAIFSSWSLPSYVFSLHKPESRISQLEEIQSLGKASFIGDYWSSYLICSVNPQQFNCTPHDRNADVRCFRCVPEVFSSPFLYLVKDKWLKSFPDEINQFGVNLRKVGNYKTLGGYTFAPYKPVDKVAWQEIKVLDLLENIYRHSIIKIPLLVKNKSNSLWSPIGFNPTQFSYQWIDNQGKVVIKQRQGSILTQDVPPGESIALNVRVTTPWKPGKYKLRLNMLREFVPQSLDKGGDYLDIPVEVVLQ